MSPHFEKRAKEIFHFGWEHGRYGDYWSFVHVLTGILFGIGAAYLGFPYWYSFFAVLIALALYELWEFFVSIVEDFENALTDVVVGQIGFVLGFYYVGFADPAFVPYAFLEVGVLALFLLSVGYRKFLKRRMKEAREERMSRRKSKMR